MKVSKRLHDMCYKLESTYGKMLGNLIANSFKIDKIVLKYFNKIEKMKIEVAKEISKNLRNKFKVKIIEVNEHDFTVELIRRVTTTQNKIELREGVVQNTTGLRDETLNLRNDFNKNEYEDKLRVLFMKQGFIEMDIINVEIDNNKICSKVELGGMAPRDEYYIGWDDNKKRHKVILKIDVIEKKMGRG